MCNYESSVSVTFLQYSAIEMLLEIPLMRASKPFNHINCLLMIPKISQDLTMTTKHMETAELSIISLLAGDSWSNVSTTHIGGECVLKLADRIGHGHGGGAGRQAEIRVFGTDAELDGGHGQHGVHVEVHAVDGRDGAAL